jgi:hypothetical protein
MEVNLSPELQATLERVAEQLGRNTESLIREAVERLLGTTSGSSAKSKKDSRKWSREVLDHKMLASAWKSFCNRSKVDSASVDSAGDLEEIADSLNRRSDNPGRPL